jgi:lipid A ethanolaminephosphotransferase
LSPTENIQARAALHVGFTSVDRRSAPGENTSVCRRAIRSASGWLRERWRTGLRCRSENRFALTLAVVWSVFYSAPFWRESLLAMWHPSLGSAGFMLSLFVLVVALQAMLVLLATGRTLMRATASVLFVVAATSTYFSVAYGALMNRDMLRNLLETDSAEVGGLLNARLIATVVVCGVIPAILVWRVAIPDVNWRQRLSQRLGFFVVATAVCAAGLFSFSANYAVFFRAHKPVRYLLMPAAPTVSLVGLLGSGEHGAANQPLINSAGRAQRSAYTYARPMVVFVVVGETARAANFQLGGYDRATTPELQSLAGSTAGSLVYFSQAVSCGTSTAESVPCMFGDLGRERFRVEEAQRHTNLLDALTQAGVDVEWRDNNAGCKGVCARVRSVDFSDLRDPRLCEHANCYDEILLSGLAARLAQVHQDTVIVFHQIGSHGPAYAERYPAGFERFTPSCRTNELQHCTAEEVRNAYDNTIAYTDHVLARLIDTLRAASDRVDGLLIYASDHGESLGEQGMYLHGMPYGFAPRTQKDIPMFIWTSPQYETRIGLRKDCLQARASQPSSHDNLYHTILGATDVRNQAYAARLDLLAGCRAAHTGLDHE